MSIEVNAPEAELQTLIARIVRELLSEITYVGGARVDVILSNCWDRPRYEHDNEMMYRSNICLVIRKTGEVGC